MTPEDFYKKRIAHSGEVIVPRKVIRIGFDGKPIENTSSFWQFDTGGAEFDILHGKPDCAIRAIAICEAKPYESIRDKFPFKSYGVLTSEMHKYLDHLNFVYYDVNYTLQAKELKGRTIAKFNGHVACVIDGITHDTYDSTANGLRRCVGFWSKP